tara:strand:+ start:571 stop:891 length:321 start_codon:yes stop_codon:yes gene_type:complete
MKNQNEYNGWTNWETWVVNLWMDNDQELYDHYGKMARVKVSKDKRSASYKLSLAIQEQVDDWMPHLDNSLYLDLLNGAMREVNWIEIARHILDRIEDEDSYIKEAN